MTKFLKQCLFFTAMAALFPFMASADAIDDIKAKGKLTVGVKADYKPYGFRDPSGDIIGIEPELAQDVADKLGVDLELVPVVSSNRMQFLAQGKVDLMIATMTDKPDRREVVYIIDPNYYSSGTNILAWKKVGFKTWDDLDGKPVCGIQGAFYNKQTEQNYGAKIIAFGGTAEILTALKQGSCLAFVYDDSFIVSKLGEEDWAAEFEMPLETIDDAPWGLAVQLGEEGFAKIMNEMIVGWHKSGRILELETKFGVPNSPFAMQMNEKYKGM